MANRQRMSRRSSRRNFTKNASRTPSINISRPVMRGGFRI